MNAVDIHAGDELRDLYQELILDHSRSPRHFGKLADATHSAGVWRQTSAVSATG